MSKKSISRLVSVFLGIALCIPIVGCSTPAKTGKDLVGEYLAIPEVAAYINDKDCMEDVMVAVENGDDATVAGKKAVIEKDAQALVKLSDIPEGLEGAHDYLCNAAVFQSEALSDMVAMAMDIRAGGTGKSSESSAAVALKLATENINMFTAEIDRVAKS